MFKNLTGVVALCTTTISYAVPVDSIVARNTFPIAPRGGVLMARLLSDELGDEWPSIIPVTFEDGTTRDGVVGWIETITVSTSWVDDSVVIRPISSSDSTETIHPRDTITGPVLLVELPTDGTGSIYFGAESVVPNWLELPLEFPDFSLSQQNTKEPLSFSIANDVPPTNALHYWRWAMLASRDNAYPPEIPGNSSVERLAAQHSEQLWRIALHNLFVASRAVGATCLDLLTDKSTDGKHAFACWVENQTSLEELLGILLDTNLTSKQLATRALRWCDQQPRSLVWFDSIFGPSITIKVSNNSPEFGLYQFTWEGEDEIPLALEVQPYRTEKMTLTRPKVLDLSIFGPVVTPPVQKVVMKTAGHSTLFPIERRVVDARPPRVLLPNLTPTWTLASLRRGYARKVSPEYETRVEVRYLMGNWEIFIRCKGNAASPTPSYVSSDRLVPVGTEAISLFFPEIKDPVVIQPDTLTSSAFELYTQSSNDGWSARIIVPETLIQSGALSFSIARTHGGSSSVETSPLPCMPWDINPAPIVINTRLWNTIDDIPITPET
jgi:hypothetical protein